MNILEVIINKILIFGKEPQNIGLSGINNVKNEIKQTSSKKKKSQEIKLSDFMKQTN